MLRVWLDQSQATLSPRLGFQLCESAGRRSAASAGTVDGLGGLSVFAAPAALDLHKCILALYFLTFQYFDVILSTATSAWVTRDGYQAKLYTKLLLWVHSCANTQKRAHRAPRAATHAGRTRCFRIGARLNIISQTLRHLRQEVINVSCAPAQSHRVQNQRASQRPVRPAEHPYGLHA